MSFVVSNTHETEKITMNNAYDETFLSLVADNDKLVQVEADLGRCLHSDATIATLKEKYPKQYIDCGIQEANMVSMSCGLSLMGYVPFAHTFAAFASRRAADQVFMCGCYQNANVRIIATDPGIAAQLNGGTHMPFEDISLYRAFPNLTIIEPTDTAMLRDLLKQLATSYGMYYIRLHRKNPVKIYENGSTFTIGKANVVREGKDVTIISCGAIMVGESLKAADILAAEGISARVVDMFTIKPIDEEAVIAAAKETGAIVTAENHNVLGGLGSAVADVVATKAPVPMEKVGVQDRFGEVGSMDYLKGVLHLTAADIAEAAKKAISRK